MSTIIAGRFDEQAEVGQTVNDLYRAGFAADQIETFFVNPPGQHDTYPVGGDQAESAGATHADATAVGGVGVGAVVGIGAGLIVAVHAPDQGTQSQAIAVLRARDAKDIEGAEGKWVAGSWSDFDPLLPARLVGTKTSEDADSSIGVGRTQSRLVQ